MEPTRRALPFNELSRSDIGRVGGKNASLGEMANRLGAAGIPVPPGFATTAEAYERDTGEHRPRRDGAWRHRPVGPGGGRSAPSDSPVGCCAP